MIWIEQLVLINYNDYRFDEPIAEDGEVKSEELTRAGVVVVVGIGVDLCSFRTEDKKFINQKKPIKILINRA